MHFTGKERDSESGLDFFGARYDASSFGRFMTPDWSANAEPVPYAKLLNPQSLNLYSYVLNNPSNGLDFDGHNTDCGGSNALGAGCQAIAAWNTLHEVSVAAWKANNFDSSFWAPQQNSNNASQTSTAGQDQSHSANISVWPTGAGGLFHLGIGVDTDDTQGFSTYDPQTPWWKRLFGAPKARIEFDIEAHARNGEIAWHSYIRIPISAEQAQAMRAAILNRTKNPGRYNLLFNNCAAFVESVLHAGGVPGVPHREIFGPALLAGVLWVEHPQ